jgi:hypothetical protein
MMRYSQSAKFLSLSIHRLRTSLCINKFAFPVRAEPSRLAGLIALSTLLAGCATTTLDRTVISQASGITLIQQEMVLNNVAMFRKRPNSLPWHVKVTSGTVSVSDSLAPSFQLAWSPTLRTLAIAPSRSVSLQWSIVPVTDNAELTALTSIYRGAALTQLEFEAALKSDPTIARPPCAYDEAFEESVGPSFESPHGKFDGKVLRVKRNASAETCFDRLVKLILDAAPVSPQDRGLIVPLNH